MDWSSQVLGGGGGGPGLISDDDDSLCLLIFSLLAGSSTGPGAGREAIDGDRRLERLLGLLGLADFRGAGREAIDGARRLELLERRLDLLGLADFGGSTGGDFFLGSRQRRPPPWLWQDLSIAVAAAVTTESASSSATVASDAWSLASISLFAFPLLMAPVIIRSMVSACISACTVLSSSLDNLDSAILTG